MKLPKSTGLFLPCLLLLACSPDRPPSGTAAAADSLRLDETALRRATPFDPDRHPLSRRDAAALAGADSVVYTVDTLVSAGSDALLLIGRLYAGETIGWLVSRRQPLGGTVVYYDNAEGWLHTDATWFPARRQALIRTRTYDEAGNEVASQSIYRASLSGP